MKVFGHRPGLGINGYESERSAKLLAEEFWCFRPITPPPECLRPNLPRGRRYRFDPVHSSIRLVKFREKLVHIHKLASISFSDCCEE